MSKYNEQFKLAIAEQYSSGASGCKQIADEHSIPVSMVKLWVGLHRAHGTDGLAKKYSRYTAEFKLAVLRLMWDDALSYRQVAAVFDIRNHSCIARWVRCYHIGDIDALAPRKRGKPKKMPTVPDTEPPESIPDPAGPTYDELVTEVNQLRMEVAYLKKLEALVQAKRQQQMPTRKKQK